MTRSRGRRIGSPSAGGRGNHSVTGPSDPARRRPTGENGAIARYNAIAIYRPPPAPQSPPAERNNVDDAWRSPETLLESLNALAAAGPTKKWATGSGAPDSGVGSCRDSWLGRVRGHSGTAGRVGLPSAPIGGEDYRQVAGPKAEEAGFALGRRIDVWQEVVRLGARSRWITTCPR